MHRQRRFPHCPFSHRLTTWLAVAVLLGHVLVPIYAMAAISGSKARSRIPICTPQGVVWVTLGVQGTPEENDRDPAAKPTACPFCLSFATPFAPPHEAQPAPAMVRPCHVVRGPGDDARRSTPAFSTHHSRAPPRFA